MAHGAALRSDPGRPRVELPVACTQGAHGEIGKTIEITCATSAMGQPSPTRNMARCSCTVAEALKTLPRIFLDFVLPQLPGLSAVRGKTAGYWTWAVAVAGQSCRSLGRLQELLCRDRRRGQLRVELAQRLIVERDLADRCKARAQSVGQRGGWNVRRSYEFPCGARDCPTLKAAAFAAVARALKPGGCFLIFDETYPETDEALRTMPTRFAAGAVVRGHLGQRGQHPI